MIFHSLLHLQPSIERGKSAFAAQGYLDPATLNPPLLPPAVVAIAALVTGGSQQAMETSPSATRPPLALRTRVTRERRGDAPAMKDMLELPSRTPPLEPSLGVAE